MSSALLLSLLLPTALASEPGAQDVWHHYERNRFDEAVKLSVALLEEDASDLEVHRVYVTALQRKDWNAPRRLEPVYGAWLEERPDDPVARFAYASVLHASTRGKGCDRAMPLLDPLPDEPESRYSALRIKRTWIQSCEAERVDEVDALIAEMDETVPAAWSYAIWLKGKAGDWREVLEKLPEVIERYPGRMNSIAAAADASDDPAAEAVLDAAMDWARGWKDETDPKVLLRMTQVLALKGDPDKGPAKAARARLDELEPPGESSQQEATKLQVKIYEANKQPTHELAYEALMALEKKMPEEGPERDTWNYFRSQRLEGLDRPDEAYEVAADMARSQPDNGDAVNSWAYEASLRGEDLEAAIEAMERVLPALDEASLDLAWGGYDDWMRNRLSARSAWEDTYGWLLHQVGRDEEAAAVLIKASQSVRDATVSAHTGLVLLELGRESQAWPYLVDANTQEGGTGEEELDGQMREALEKLWPERAEWHPDGLDGWLEARRAAEADDEEVDASEEVGSEHALIGEDFPYDSADKLGGGTLTFADEGLLVVDLWATWCGPCVQGMPHLQEVARAYSDKGVRVVGLSVDENANAVAKFYKGVDPDVIAYELGHVGRSGFDTMKVSGIPALFVVSEGKIVSYIRGYGGSGDDRLERALDELL